jgi:hypothetical protein
MTLVNEMLHRPHIFQGRIKIDKNTGSDQGFEMNQLQSY